MLGSRFEERSSVSSIAPYVEEDDWEELMDLKTGEKGKIRSGIVPRKIEERELRATEGFSKP